MSTRSSIAIKKDNGEIKGIYCHFDGYPEYVGKILINNFTAPQKIEALLALGDISSLDETLEKCEAYHRDRGETLNPAYVSASPKEYVDHFHECWCEYFYLFQDSKWYVSDCENGEWRTVCSELGLPESLLSFNELVAGHDYVNVQRNKRNGEQREVECSVVNAQLTQGETKIAYGIWSNPDEWETVGYYEKEAKGDIQNAKLD